ncbi:MAG: isopentenyl-diphosphate Delta-isomerase [Flammeovirgaceae bacterium]|nr:isopentenyl-diphosphate Delta-isomerase [Flammeovirgaceae bacterium]
MTDNVILVDESDNELSTMPKLEAHEKGLLHRAFSILIFNSKGEILLQQRAETKYHSAGLWTNTCCSHPLPGETNKQAARRKLKQEMGIEVPLNFLYSFIYKTELENNLIEHEFDHVYIGKFNGNPVLNPEEAQDWRWESFNSVIADTKLNPDKYSYWFRLILDRIESDKLVT